MNNPINLVWAVPINHARLGARVEAYVESKAAITVFRLCVEKSNLWSRLPPELVDIMANKIKYLAYQDTIAYWLRAEGCVANTCVMADHFNVEEILEFKDCDCSVASSESKATSCHCVDDVEDIVLPEKHKRHDDTIKGHLRKIWWSATSQKFARYIDVSNLALDTLLRKSRKIDAER